MDNYLLVIIICAGVFVVALVWAIWYFLIRNTEGENTNTPVIDNNNTPRTPTRIEKNDIATINVFFNQTQKNYDDGRNDAVKDDTAENLLKGLKRIKDEGKQLCDVALLAYQKKIIKLENDIKEENRFLEVEGRSENCTTADRIAVEKDNTQKDIDYIQAKKTSLDDNDLGIYASYKAGFAKGRNDKER